MSRLQIDAPLPTPDEHKQLGVTIAQPWRPRLARYVLGVSWFALVLGVTSIFGIGLYIMISTLPFFVLGTALYPSRAHRWIGAIGVAGSLVGAALLIYFAINFT